MRVGRRGINRIIREDKKFRISYISNIERLLRKVERIVFAIGKKILIEIDIPRHKYFSSIEIYDFISLLV